MLLSRVYYNTISRCFQIVSYSRQLLRKQRCFQCNLENVNNNRSNNNESNFKAFKGKGVTVGSDENITRDNVDYSNLASRNNEDLNSTDSRLDLNTTSSPV